MRIARCAQCLAELHFRPHMQYLCQVGRVVSPILGFLMVAGQAGECLIAVLGFLGTSSGRVDNRPTYSTLGPYVRRGCMALPADTFPYQSQ